MRSVLLRRASWRIWWSGPRFLWRQTGHHRQRRDDRLRADGRHQRLDPHAAAGALPPDVCALGAARHATRLTFVSQAADASGIPQRLGLQSATAVVKGCRTVKKADMIHNDLQPNITVDSQTYEVRVDGELITSEPAEVLPMAQRYFLF